MSQINIRNTSLASIKGNVKTILTVIVSLMAEANVRSFVAAMRYAPWLTKDALAKMDANLGQRNQNQSVLALLLNGNVTQISANASAKHIHSMAQLAKYVKTPTLPMSTLEIVEKTMQHCKMPI